MSWLTVPFAKNHHVSQQQNMPLTPGGPGGVLPGQVALILTQRILRLQTHVSPGSPGLSTSLLLKSPVQTQHHAHTLHSFIDFSMDISIQQLGHTCSVPGVVLAAERTWQRERPSSWNHRLGRERQTVDR